LQCGSFLIGPYVFGKNINLLKRWVEVCREIDVSRSIFHYMMSEYVSFWSFISAGFANFVQFASCLQSFVQKLRQHCISWPDTIQNILPHDLDSLKEYEMFGAIVANVISLTSTDKVDFNRWSNVMIQNNI
jgi:hypothetical protein